ncbi:MAG: hypothetical protein BMS9Abin28_0662 [Anaerolineae bacterium]|nr:MAG: hypothetical protein BMS9Abin28_0662 [Anaerolineae bacterium]
MYCMADRDIAPRTILRVIVLLILILLLLSILGHYAGDAFAPSPVPMSSTLQGSMGANTLIAHPVHYALSWAWTVGLGMLIGLIFKLAMPFQFDASRSFPPPDRPPIITS